MSLNYLTLGSSIIQIQALKNIDLIIRSLHNSSKSEDK